MTYTHNLSASYVNGPLTLNLIFTTFWPRPDTVDSRDVSVGLKWVRMDPNETNLGLLKISFKMPKCSEIDLKKSEICLIWCKSGPIGDQI